MSPRTEDEDEVETPFPELSQSESLTGFGSHLSPDDAFTSPPRRSFAQDTIADARAARLARLTEPGERSHSRRRHKRVWKKLMWVKQSYPDNYTDQATFLENLQRNPRLKPYDFWPLVVDSTVILQHLCSVIIFVVCFVGISQERVPPVSAVSWSSGATFLGWILWERWVSEEEDLDDQMMMAAANSGGLGVGGVRAGSGTAIGSTGATSGTGGAGAAQSSSAAAAGGTGIARSGGSLRRRNRAASIRRPLPPLLRSESGLPTTTLSATPSAAPSAASSSTNLLQVDTSRPSNSASSTSLNSLNGPATQQPQRPQHTPRPSNDAAAAADPLIFPEEENRLHQRLGTIKSAILIYCTLLGLSPILKSLTQSTWSDSIWAMSFWLLFINVFFFDYSGGVGAKFPASLSTNAAIMASTVLASRLLSTKQVFSLTLFSIEVFGLFPVFRRHVRHRSARYHALLTLVLVLGAGFGVGTVLADTSAGPNGPWPWKSGIVGMVVGLVVAALGTGGCSWWLIGLQKYKNEIRGPWDQARPIIMSRPRWDDK